MSNLNPAGVLMTVGTDLSCFRLITCRNFSFTQELAAAPVNQSKEVKVSFLQLFSKVL